MIPLVFNSFRITLHNGHTEVLLISVISNNSASAEFIVILDISGSMDSDVKRIITQILPNMLTKLNYQDDDIIHLITFDSWVEYHPMTKKQLENSTISWMRDDDMREVFNVLSNIILTKQTCFRILTISDGDVMYQ